MTHQDVKVRYRDYPLDEVVKKAEWFAEQGCTTFQKFTCAGCGARLTVDTPNSFHVSGTCDKCGHLTNIRARGCNLMVIQSTTPVGPQA